MKIAFIGLRCYPHSYAGVSGIETRTEKVIQHLSLKHHIYVFVRNWHPIKNQSNPRIHIIPVFSPQHKYIDTVVYSFLSSIQASFLPIETAFIEGTASSLFCFIPKLFGKKIVVTMHSLEWVRKKWNFFAKIALRLSEIIAISCADYIIAVAKHLNEYVLKKYQKRAFFIPYFIKHQKLVPPSIIKDNLGLEKDRFILFLGRFTPEKRIEWLIKAYTLISPSAKLVLAGGKTHDVSYYSYIRSLVKDIKDIVLTGYVFGKEKEELLSNCLLFVSPSETEGFSIALSEALSYRKPALIASNNSYPEISKFLFHFKYDDFNDFKKKLESLVKKKFPNNDGPHKHMTYKKFIGAYDNVVSFLQNTE